MPAPNYTQIIGAAGQVQGVSPQTSDVQTGTLVSELNARFYQLAYQGKLWSGGMSALTSINNATFTTATLGATQTPIAGVWNPASSPINVVVLQVQLSITLTALTATGAAPFSWATSTGNSALTLGNAPLNRKTLATTGSQAKDMSGVALTGLTNNLVVRNGTPIYGGTPVNTSQIYTIAGIPQHIAAVENIDGAWIVPPGGILSLLATTTPVAHSAVSGMIWTELPL